MAIHVAVCQDNSFWDACDWTTYDGTVIANITERDAYYSARYASLAAWDIAERGYLTEAYFCEVLGPWPIAQALVNLSGSWGASYLVPLTIATVGIARHDGSVTANCYRVESATECFNQGMSVSGIVWDGFVGICSSTSHDTFTFPAYGNSCRVLNSIAIGGRIGFSGLAANGSAGGYSCVNCLAIDTYSSGFQWRTFSHLPGDLINCTAFGCNTSNNAYRAGIFIDSGSYTRVLNCLSMDSVRNDFRLTGAWDPEYSISSDTTLSGKATCLTGISSSATFVDAANDNFNLLASAAAKDSGIYIAGITPEKDIAGISRDPANVDVGAFEYDTGYIPTLIVPLSFTGIAEHSVLALYDVVTMAEIIAPQVISAAGSYSTTYPHTGNVSVLLRVRNGSGLPNYQPYSALGTITENGLTMIVSQVEDPINVTN